MRKEQDRKRRMQGQGSGSNTRQRPNPQQGFQWNRGQYPQRPQNQPQNGNQRQHFQQRLPHQQQGGQQTPRSGNPNATPMKNSAPNTPTRCFCCGKEGHMSFNCPDKQNQQTPQRNSSNQKPPHYGKVNHVSSDTTHEALEVMLGTFNINSISATILFDSRASHSFISQAFVREHSVPLVAMKNPMIVNSPGGTVPLLIIVPQHVFLLGGRLPS
jgi:hypothetical protein